MQTFLVRVLTPATATALCLLAAACGGSDSAPGGAAPEAAGASAAATAGVSAATGAPAGSARDACALVTAAEVTAAAGTPVGAGRLTLGDAEQISICGFDAAQLSVTYSPRIGAQELGSTRPPNATDVPGLGDRAYVYSIGSDLVKVTTLAMVKGDAGVLLVSNQLDAAPLRTLAATIAGRL
jgi:hypothetical protein